MVSSGAQDDRSIVALNSQCAARLTRRSGRPVGSGTPTESPVDPLATPLHCLQSNTKALAELHKPAKAFERPGLTAEEIEEIREAFRLFDADESGEQGGTLVDSGSATCCDHRSPIIWLLPSCLSPTAGTIDPRELKEAMQSLGLDAKSGTVYAMITAFDRDADKRIDFAEFLDLMTAKMVRRLLPLVLLSLLLCGRARAAGRCAAVIE